LTTLHWWTSKELNDFPGVGPGAEPAAPIIGTQQQSDHGPPSRPWWNRREPRKESDEDNEKQL
jgi:hypothetical protein